MYFSFTVNKDSTVFSLFRGGCCQLMQIRQLCLFLGKMCLFIRTTFDFIQKKVLFYSFTRNSTGTFNFLFFTLEF